MLKLKKLLNTRASMFVGLLTTLFTPFVFAQTHQEAVRNENEAAQHSGDNTGRNIRDRNEYRKTADDQKLAGKEIEILARVRRNIIVNENLSVNGKNVKIIVDKGVVTLRGPVNSLQEKSWIEAAATQAASECKVVSELEVVSN